MSEMARPNTIEVSATALGWSALAFPLALHSVHHAFGDRVPLLSFFGFAVFGGIALLLAGVYAVRNHDTFFTTAFTIFGLFWLNQATFGVLVMTGHIPPSDTGVNQEWMWLAITIFTIYMIVSSARVSLMALIFFVTLELSQVLLTLGFFQNERAGQGLVSLAGFIGTVAGLLAWYIAAAEIAQSVGASWSLPLGRNRAGVATHPGEG